MILMIFSIFIAGAVDPLPRKCLGGRVVHCDQKLVYAISSYVMKVEHAKAGKTNCCRGL